MAYAPLPRDAPVASLGPLRETVAATLHPQRKQQRPCLVPEGHSSDRFPPQQCARTPIHSGSPTGPRGRPVTGQPLGSPSKRTCPQRVPLLPVAPTRQGRARQGCRRAPHAYAYRLGRNRRGRPRGVRPTVCIPRACHHRGIRLPGLTPRTYHLSQPSRGRHRDIRLPVAEVGLIEVGR